MADYIIHDELYQEARARNWQGWGGDERIEKVSQTIARIFSHPGVSEKGKALELGCGEGNLSRKLHERGFFVTGIDVSPTAIEWAKEKTSIQGNDIEFMCRDLTQPYPLLNGPFDLIVDGNCFHCILGEDRKIFLQNIRDSLKKSGTFFVSSLCSKKDENETILYKGKPYRHISTPDNLIFELTKAGFKVLKSEIFPREKFNHMDIHSTL